MRTIRTVAFCATMLLVSMTSFSCNNGQGIFTEVQDEEEQSGDKLFQKTQVTNAFRLGYYYYASTATLNCRAVTESSWAKVKINGLSRYTLYSAVLAGGTTPTIYVLLDNDGTREAYSSSDGSTWSSIALPSGTTFDALYATSSGEVYAENHYYDEDVSTKSTYTLYHYDSSAFVQVLADVTLNADETIRGVVYDSASALYWFASQSHLYSSSNADLSSRTAQISNYTGLSSDTIWGISYANGYVYISTKSGELYQSGTATGDDVASVPLTAVVAVPYSGGTELLVGTDAYTKSSTTHTAVGYYEGSFGSFSLGKKGEVTKKSAIWSTTVSDFPVHAFFYDSTGVTTTNTDGSTTTTYPVFICISPGTTSTSYYGLYSSNWDGSAWDGWDAE
jgi:hypothetical protein